MINVAVVSKGVVINVVVFHDEDRDLIDGFDFPEAEDAIGIPLDDGQIVSEGYLYEDGKFTAPPVPEPTKEELIRQAENERQARLASADVIFLEWQTKLLLNIASDEEKQAVINWVNYKDQVRLVNPYDAPDIEWPEQPAIPENAQ